jgi:hypothetical protein
MTNNGVNRMRKKEEKYLTHFKIFICLNIGKVIINSMTNNTFRNIKKNHRWIDIFTQDFTPLFLVISRSVVA